VSVGFDASLLYSKDPARVIRDRLWMKMVLARYARVDPFSWEHRDVGEMRDAFEVVVEILKNEGGSPEDA